MKPAAGWIHPRDEIMRMMERIYRFRMTTTSGGNLSIRDDNGGVWITPARLDKGALRREDVVHVLPDGAAEGPHKPSSEHPFHRAVYAARPDVGAVVHAHPVALVAFSICRRVPDTRLLPQARRICGEVGFAPYALPGSEKLGRSIAEAFGRGFNCVVLENHGVVTAGATLQEAFDRFEALEFTAKTIIKASHLGEVKYLTDEDAGRARRVEPSASWSRSGPPSSGEKELRRQLVEFVRRCYQQRLMISTVGAFSARVDGDSFLMTPHRVDRQGLEAGDLVLVRGGAPEAGGVPSSAWLGHRAIYGAHRDVQAIVNAYPVNATAFSVTDAPFDSRTIPESYLFLRDVPRLPYGVRFGDGRELARRTSLDHPVVLLEHDGVQVCGRSILDAFDRLEVVESTAEAMINARALGPMAPMPDDVIAELDAAFGRV